MSNIKEDIFAVTPDLQKLLGIGTKSRSGTGTFTLNTLRIFFMAKSKLNRESLAIKDVTAAYYNLYHNKSKLTLTVYKMSIRLSNLARSGLLKRISTGIYALPTSFANKKVEDLYKKYEVVLKDEF